MICIQDLLEMKIYTEGCEMENKRIVLNLNLNLGFKDFEYVYRKAIADGLSLSDLLECFIGDLAGGSNCSGSDEYDLAHEWYDRHGYEPESKSFLLYLMENEWADPDEISETLKRINISTLALEMYEQDHDEENRQICMEDLLADVEEVYDLYRAYDAECADVEELHEALKGVCNYTLERRKMSGLSFRDYQFNEQYWEDFDSYVKVLEDNAG